MNFDKIKGYVKNEEIIKNLFYGVLGVIPFVMFAIYILFFSDFQFDRSVSYKTVGILTAITLIGIRIYRFIGIRVGKQNGLRVNEKLTNLEEDIDKIEFSLNDDTYGVIAVNELNRDKQRNRNIILTQNTIAKLENKKRKFKKSGKDSKVKAIDKEIEYLRSNELHDDSFIPFDYYVFEGAKSEVNSKPIDGANINKKVEDEGKLTSWIINVATAILGGTVGLGFAIGLPFWVIVGALVSLILSMGLTFLINFSLVYLKINTNGYFKKRKQVHEIKNAIYERVQELKKEKVFVDNLPKLDGEVVKTYDEVVDGKLVEYTTRAKENIKELSAAERLIIKNYCGNCLHYGITCGGLVSEHLAKGVLDCEDKSVKGDKNEEKR